MCDHDVDQLIEHSFADDAGLAFPYVRRFWRIYVASGAILEQGCINTRVQRTGAEKSWCIGLVADWAVSSSLRLRRRVEQGKAISREARNAAYFRARRRRDMTSNISVAVSHGDVPTPSALPTFEPQTAPRFGGVSLGALSRARRAARQAERAAV